MNDILFVVLEMLHYCFKWKYKFLFLRKEIKLYLKEKSFDGFVNKQNEFLLFIKEWFLPITEKSG